MSSSSHIKNSELISSRDAARFFGYTPDYVSRLARQGKINAERLGHQWFIDLGSLKRFVENTNSSQRERMYDLSTIRKMERKHSVSNHVAHSKVVEISNKYSDEISALLQAGAVVFSGFLLAVFFSVPSAHVLSALEKVHFALVLNLKYTAYGTYHAIDQTEKVENAASIIGVEEITPTREAEVKSTEGVVIFEKNKDESILENAEASFSDPVDVTFDSQDPNVGIITPRFENGGSDQYRFLIVPVDPP